MIINNKKFTNIYNKIIHDIESLKSFYLNRYILELEFGTINFILGEIIVSTIELYNIIITIKKEYDGLELLISNIKDIRLLINRLVLLIVISFNNDEKNDNNDDFICNNDDYNLNFFNLNKKNYNTIKIINSNFKIIKQNIENIKKNNKIVIDNIKINILFNKIKNNFDTTYELYLQLEKNINNTKDILTNNITEQKSSIPNTKLDISITFNQFCLLNNKNKIKVIIKLIVNIIKNINYKELNFYNITLFGFIFLLCFY